jgi:lipid II:glycine glycyltransferase (peptidoglycan interpeptide bridge formation enzyme)
VRHRLAVHGDLERLRAGLGKMHRRNLKTAEKGGVEVELGRGDAELRSFHRLHVLTRQRLGVPTQPPRFFKALGRFIDRDGLGFILSARVDGATVASGVFLAWNGVLVYKFGASDARNWPSRPNNLLFWVAIRWAAEHGYHTLDFGRTELENQGLRQFKLGWGAVEEPLVYTTLAAASPAPSSGRAQALAGEAIRRSPAWVGQAVGRVLYRYSA